VGELRREGGEREANLGWAEMASPLTEPRAAAGSGEAAVAAAREPVAAVAGIPETRSEGWGGAARVPVSPNPAAAASRFTTVTARPTARPAANRPARRAPLTGDELSPPAGIAPAPAPLPLLCCSRQSANHPRPPLSRRTCPTDAVTKTEETEPHRLKIASAARSARSRVDRIGSSGQSRRAGASDWAGGKSVRGKQSKRVGPLEEGDQ
jgi:hypothetical protein